jgi:undecaprenyl-diphosphatase
MGSKSLSPFIARTWKWTRNRDLVVLLLSLVTVLGLWFFLAIASSVRTGSTAELDREVLRAIRDPNNLLNSFGQKRVEQAFRDITALGSYAVLTLTSCAVCGYLLLVRKYHAFLLLLAALTGGMLLNRFLKQLYNRPRPDHVAHLDWVDSYSFPSGHAMLAAVVYLTLGALVSRLVEKRWQKLYVLGVALLFTFLVSSSRVYLGVHYPSDVLAGWTVGLIWAILCWLTARYLQRRGEVERPGPEPASRRLE